ncbi:uncharacterized protein UV8b_00271 [Ustilaginoidea virens]|uniref:Uncharacterized protein n=1 Tax=Ustilaginoidea virens TaxID=1159556 RepID=A0A8E5HIG0_USTVR|nr:uncharacterized protein UV8b_00271 [Ustilaginoidea virens]QUC16030.1 hypothetical protein UV8b_00271 [Ustilaginoidea virens]
MFPPGLDSLYKRMMEQISQSVYAKLCKQVLASITLVYRPITLEELLVLFEPPKGMAANPESMREVVGHCGSFLVLREETVYFVHQSAKDFLLEKNMVKEEFPLNEDAVHSTIFTRSLDILSRTLQRDMYNLKDLGHPIEEAKPPEPDPLGASRYSCVYWVDHLCASVHQTSTMPIVGLENGGRLDKFLRNKYLYWLEALSLCNNVPKGIVSMAKLCFLIQERGVSHLTELARDAHRFIMYSKGAIESHPLQAFRVAAVAFSSDSTRLASASDDDTIKIWDAHSGNCLQTLTGHKDSVHAVAFSGDSTWLASALEDETVKIWDTRRWNCVQTLEGYNGSIDSVAFSCDSVQLASVSWENIIKIWDTSNWTCLKTLPHHSKPGFPLAFSGDFTRLASVSDEFTLKVWDTHSWTCLQTFEGRSDSVSIVFSPNSTQIVSASDDGIIKIWDVRDGTCLQTLTAHIDRVYAMAFSNDSIWLASASRDTTIKIWNLASASIDGTVKIWDVSSNVDLKSLEGHCLAVESVAFTHNSTWLASASEDRTIKIWETSNGKCLKTLEGHYRFVKLVIFSHNSAQLASMGSSSSKIWDTGSGACLHTLNHGPVAYVIAFSHDSTRLATVTDSTVQIWDTRNGELLRAFSDYSDGIFKSVAFSHDSARLATGCGVGVAGISTVTIWDARNGECLHRLDQDGNVNSVAFSRDSAKLASAGSTVKIWDADSGVCLETLTVNSYLRVMSFDSSGDRLNTTLGVISLCQSEASGETDVVRPKPTQFAGIGISTEDMWITYNGSKLLWIPPEYRSKCFDICENNLGIGVRSGKVWICTVDRD